LVELLAKRVELARDKREKLDDNDS